MSNATTNKAPTYNQLQETAIRAQGYAADVAAAVAGALEGMDEAKSDKGRGVPFIIPANGWAEDEIDEDAEDEMNLSAYPYYIDIALNGMRAIDRVDVTVGPSGYEESVSCGLCPFTEAFNGKFRLRATKRPTTNMAAEYWLFSGKE